MSGLEVIRERREVDCHFLRFGRFSKQIFVDLTFVQTLANV